MFRKTGLLIVLSGPSGAGKGTVCRALLNCKPEISFSISVTTRAPRVGEIDGVDYFFVTPEEFQRKLDRDEFLEWAEFDGNLYGTPRWYVETLLASRRDVILDIEVQGARQVRQKYPDAVLVFVLPPSLEELRARLEKRGEQPEVVERRLGTAKQQLKQIHMYDYVVVNDRVESVVETLEAIITAERCRLSRLDFSNMGWGGVEDDSSAAGFPDKKGG